MERSIDKQLTDHLNGVCTAGTSFCLTFDANNRVNSGALAYDAAGNVTQDSSHYYYYDAEDRLIQVDGTLGNCSTATACYVYDAEGRRVQKTVAGATVGYIYDVAGHQVAEVNSSGGVNRAEVYAAGMHLATYANGLSGTTYFDHADWLGTERVRSGMNAQAAEQCTSLAFGDGLSCSGNDASPMHFTGKERDSESGNDYFGARYFGSSLGRFMSPDDPFADQRTGDPQSWNLYSYVRNNPLTFDDPDGHACVQGSDGTFHDDNSGGQSCADASQPQVVQVNAKAPPAIEVFAVNLFNAVDNVANDYFSFFLGGYRPSYMQNTQIGNGFAAQAGATVGIIGTLLVGPEEDGIRITQEGLEHIAERHMVGGAGALAKKSIFNAGEDVAGLIKAAEGTAPTKMAGGDFARVVDAGRPVGIDRATGAPTSMYTVITDSAGNLKNAFPGRP